MALKTWSRDPETVMVLSGSLGVSSESDWTRIVAPESEMKSRTVCPLCPIRSPHRRRERASLTWESPWMFSSRWILALAAERFPSREIFSRIRKMEVRTEWSEPERRSTRSEVPAPE